VEAPPSSENAEQLLRTVLACAPVILFALDERGVVTLAAGHGLAMAGKTASDRVGRSALEYYAAHEELVRDIHRALAGEEFSAEHTVGTRTLESHYRPLRDADGRARGTVGVSIDVTERRRADEERAKMQELLIQSQKLEGLGMLAGGVAHDFNNLLASILGNASLALADPSSPDNVQRLHDVVAVARQAADLTRQMLAYAGRASVEAGHVCISQQVRDMARLLQSSVSRRVDLVLRLAPDLPAVEADASQIRQVVMNLAMNGAEAIEAGAGTVTVSTAVRDLGAADVRDLLVPGPDAALPPGRYVVLRVEDTGVGIDASTRARIFDPFFTTKVSGRGLGLAMVLGIVRSHRGALRVESTPGRGTCFEVYFPASLQAAAVAAPREALPLTGEGTVLIVDDEPHVRAATARILEFYGFKTISAKNGREAVELFREHDRAIRVVLLDLTMPVLGGEEALAQIRTIRGDVRVILSSGYDEREARSRLRTDERVTFLQKPFTAGELTARIREALAP
jgi:PAS domain S-box-containing protein